MNSLVRRGQQLQQFLRSNRFLVKSFSTATTESNVKEKCCYEDFIRERQVEAERSIVVQVSSEKSFHELYNYCSAFGNIINAQHYRIYHEDNMHYILLEYSSAQEAAAAIDATSYNDEMQGVPVRSPFLWFKAAQGKIKKQLKTDVKHQLSSKSLQVIEGTRQLENNELNALLQTATSIEEQIKLLYQYTQLNDLGVRMRFLAALQLQSALSGMFPQANAQPFGSSVNGFGKMGCDLDLILRFDRELLGDEARRRHESRLVFHTKENLNNGRSQVQRQMESISDIMQLFLPGVCHVRRILQARVPIIKYHHEHLNLEVDLSMSNLTGFYMSELLYMFGELDERVRPLTFCIRRWAQSCGLTNPSPGRWISNFSLTCLVMFFLQQLKLPILPAINVLTKSAKKQDIRITEDGINCTFARDMESIPFHNRNTSAINELMLQFFEFYSQFDFQNRAISLNEARAIPKPDHSPIYIVNPLETVLNVSKNISLEECERLRIEVRNAAWVLESEVENTALPKNAKLESPWGLLNLFKVNEKSIIKPNMFFRPRMVDINELFEQKNTEAALTADSTTTPMPTNIDYKNNSVRQEVQNIKTQSRSDLKQLHMKSGSSAKVVKAKGAKGRLR